MIMTITIIIMIIKIIHCLIHFCNGCLCYRKKNRKMNKSIKIYQYINVNTKNMTTKIVTGLKTDSHRKTKKKTR